MIKFENVVTPSSEQWETIIRGLRNPLNSWGNSDSYKTYIENKDTLNTADFEFFIGENDLDLMKRLRSAGADHRKFMRMITIYVDITAPLYWWKEYDTYKVGTVANSTSTMHKIHSKPFEMEDFSVDHMTDDTVKMMEKNIEFLEDLRIKYNETKDKSLWYSMIQLLPESYNQMRTLMLNYEVLTNIYHSRKNHKLDEWHKFCDWVKVLPNSELITREEN